ncbi:hypothetical protein CYMTET_49937 [Cymbomonas tetramitiformis]|uniref:Mitochondrial carrier protein n=1 Tax=Cymbomonas tetramitiformis TaxID=36881 RepID=A0AAE0ETN3_9CHLO|nr:hypothetical protein CYMTET_49937 [Cymbomonas tetramitiformis]
MSDPAPSATSIIAAGAISGIIARCVTHPMDTVKARMQVQGPVASTALPTALGFVKYSGAFDGFKKILRTEGVFGLYRGFGVVLGTVPFASAAYFGGYESAKSLVPLEHGALAYISYGLLAQSCAGLVYTPMDIVKERLQVQQFLQQGASVSGSTVQPFNYKGTLDAIGSIFRQDGIRGMFRGYWLQNAAWWPWSIIYFCSYESTRKQLAHWISNESVDQLPSHWSALAAAGSAALATTLTNPIDVVKTRYQTMNIKSGSTASSQRNVPLTIARSMLTNEGLRVGAVKILHDFLLYTGDEGNYEVLSRCAKADTGVVYHLL